MRKIRFDTAIFFILPGLLGFITFYIWPFFISLGYALVDKPVNGVFVGLNNFIELFRNKPYLKGLINMSWFISVSVPLNILLSLAAAILINNIRRYTERRMLPGLRRGLSLPKELFTLIFLIPLVIPSGSMVFFWKSFFDYGGYLNGMLAGFGIDKINWLETSHVRVVIVTIFIWKNMGYNMVLFLAGLSNIPVDYYEAASVFGAGKLQCFRHITLIYLLPTTVLVLIMSVINSFKVFKEIYLVTGSYPHDSIYMLQHFMNNMFHSLNYQKLATATSILVIIIGALTQLLLRLERKVSV